MFCKRYLLCYLIFLAQLFAANSFATVPYLEGIEFGYVLSKRSKYLSNNTLSGIGGRIITGYFRTNYQLLFGFSHLCDIKKALPPYSYSLEPGCREFSLNMGSRYYPRRLICAIPYFGTSAVFEYIMSEVKEESPKDPPYYWTKTENRVGVNFFLGVHIPISYRLGLFGEGRFATLQNIGCCNADGNIECLSFVTGFSFKL
jgi:hypothetical protein